MCMFTRMLTCLRCQGQTYSYMHDLGSAPQAWLHEAASCHTYELCALQLTHTARFPSLRVPADPLRCIHATQPMDLQAVS